MLVTDVFVEGDATAGLEAEEGGGGAGAAVAVEPVDLDPVGKGLPDQLVQSRRSGRGR